MSGLLPLDEAQSRLLSLAAPLGSEELPVEAATGRYLAEPLIAQRDQPAADMSAMDGYATRTDDLAGPWTVIGESAAGHPYDGTLQAGECVRISTGALMPQGDCAVLLQENVDRDGARISLANEDGPTSAHIRRAGFDFRAGASLLEAGSKIAAPQIALAMMGGRRTQSVGKQPRVAIIDSGDELSDALALAPHQIPATNGAMITQMCQPFAREVTRLGPINDELKAVTSAFDEAGDADVIITSGGASVGDHDLIRPALAEWGAKVDFWRVAIKPGKPILIAQKGRQVIVGLPGNPVSAYVTAFLFALPLLRHLAGSIHPFPPKRSSRLLSDLPTTGPRAEFVRARLLENGVLPISERDSSALKALAATDALILRDSHSAAANAGEDVIIYPLENGGNA